ncbi:hypothetical protein ANCDUO_10745 [Ancylostoma duodenale]|uniref:Uncharacterized protein n=1 Tax=Ancylostoma duodenale TaxID=51022 RepID=A0A0C2GPY9_9BILA|nr:hypothetical protein ANCDUO_10745 [Ancylostoma duodenale]
MFVFPSLAPSIRAAFVFVQHGTGIDLSVSLCNRTFPDPERVLDSFQITDEPLDQNEHDYSLEELYRLLDVVQTELDSMRSNPEVGLRGHYIERLTRLEEKMQNFHECISQKLSAEKVEMPGGSGDNEVGDAIANVLAPYRDEPGKERASYLLYIFFSFLSVFFQSQHLEESIIPGTSGLRRFSREYARTETSTSRKNSRASV